MTKALKLEDGKTFAIWFSFFLCISSQWLCCLQPRGLNAGKHSPQGTRMSQYRVTPNERTPVPSRRRQRPESEECPTSTPWYFTAVLRSSPQRLGRNAKLKR